MAIVLAIVSCLALGYITVVIGWPRRAFTFSHLLFRACLSVGFGFGLFSLSFFLARMFGSSHFIVVDICLLALLVACYWLLRNRNAKADEIQPAAALDVPGWLRQTVSTAFVVSLSAALYSTVVRAIAHPHGEGWDAFAIWNLHARFLFLGGDHWRDGFGALIPWSHPDYPLLLPAGIAHFWSYLGTPDPRVPSVVGVVFTFGTLGLLFTSLDLLRGRLAATLGGLTLASTPFFIAAGTSQYADVPLGFFFLAATALSCLDRGDTNSRSALIALSGLAAGFAAWTKNEGMLFLLAFALSQTFATIASKRRPSLTDAHPRSRLIPLLLAMIPAILVILWFKRFVAPSSELFSTREAIVTRLLAPARYGTILQWYGKEFLRFGHWLIPGTVLLAMFYFIAFSKQYRAIMPDLRPCYWTLALTMAGYFAIYVITPYGLHWHLRFSLNRLFLQLWPCAVFLVFASIPVKAMPIVSS